MILCCGEALIDMIPTQTVDGRSGFVAHAGGAVFNTAIALGRLGAPAGMLTGLSTDLFGEQLAEELSTSGVDASFSIRSERPSTLAFVKITNGVATYSFFDENSAGRMLQPSEMPHLPEHVKVLFFGGISLACEPGADAYVALLDQAAECVVMIDPNIRAGFIQNPERYRARLMRFLERADIVKVSDEDLAWLYPDLSCQDARVAALPGGDSKVVLLTRGAEGSTGYVASGTISEPAERVDVADTVGAGDTFNAGILMALHQAGQLERGMLRDLSLDDLRKAVVLGNRAAAITVSRAGANPPWANELF